MEAANNEEDWEWDFYDDDETYLKMGFQEEDRKNENPVNYAFVNPIIAGEKQKEFEHGNWKTTILKAVTKINHKNYLFHVPLEEIDKQCQLLLDPFRFTLRNVEGDGNCGIYSLMLGLKA